MQAHVLPAPVERAQRKLNATYRRATGHDVPAGSNLNDVAIVVLAQLCDDFEADGRRLRRRVKRKLKSRGVPT